MVPSLWIKQPRIFTNTANILNKQKKHLRHNMVVFARDQTIYKLAVPCYLLSNPEIQKYLNIILWCSVFKNRSKKLLESSLFLVSTAEVLLLFPSHVRSRQAPLMSGTRTIWKPSLWSAYCKLPSSNPLSDSFFSFLSLFLHIPVALFPETLTHSVLLSGFIWTQTQHRTDRVQLLFLIAVLFLL